jgi:hypothetical protein
MMKLNATLDVGKFSALLLQESTCVKVKVKVKKVKEGALPTSGMWYGRS